MEINTRTAPTYLGSWAQAIPTAGDPCQPPFAAFNGTNRLLSDQWVPRRDGILAAPDLNDLNAPARQRVTNERLTALANEVLGKADQYQPLIDHAQAEIAAMESKLSNAKQPSDPVSLMRADQIVRYYERQPAENRLLIIQNAIQSGDVEVLRSVLSAPRVLNLVSDLTRKSVETAMMTSSDPTAFRALADLKSAVGIASAALERFRSFVRSDAGDVQNPRARLISDSQGQ
jgi:hypothetical protein